MSTRSRLEPIRKNILAAIAVAISAIVGGADSAAAQAIIAPNPRADFGRDMDREEQEDLRVKVIGGFVTLRRSRVGDDWTFNPRLADITAYCCTKGGGSVVALDCSCYGNLERGEFKYQAVDNSSPERWEGDRVVVTRTAEGLRWEDYDGNWIEYELTPRPALAIADTLIAASYGNRNGTIATLRRDSQNRLAGFVDRNDQEVLTLEYDSLDQVTHASDYTGRDVSYGYSGRKLLTFTDVRGYDWTDTYSGNYLVSRVDPEGRATSFLRNGEGLITSIKDEDGIGVDYRYDYDGKAREFYLRERFSGNRVVETWSHVEDGLRRRDLNGRTVLTVRNSGSGRTYIDEHGNETKVDLDDMQRVTGVAYPDGTSIAIEIVPGLGLPAAMTDENGIVTGFEYDERGNVVRMLEAAGRPEERVTLRQYDANGQLTEQREVVDGGSGDRVSTFTYDGYGNVHSSTDPEGNTHMMEYDVLGNTTQLTDPRGKIWEFRFDPAGDLLEAKDPRNASVLYEYDKVGNLLQTTDEENGVTQYIYNRQNNITHIVDALQNDWHYDYTEAQLLKRIVDPEGHMREYGYDRDGRLTSYQDGSGNVTAVAYLAGRTEENPAHGLLERISYPTLVREQQFDSRNRLLAETDTETSGRRLTTRWTYDGVGNVTSVTTPDLRQRSYAYDALSRLIRQTGTDGHAVQLAWGRWGNMLQITDPRQLTSALEYDKLGQLVSFLQPGGAITRYTYDSIGNVQSVVDPRNQEVRYEYDDVGRLRYERMYPVAGGGTPSRTIEYAYDSRGLLTSYVDGAASETYTADPLGRITATTVEFGPFSAGVQYGYYQNGLLKTYAGPDGVTYEYTYDGNDQLRSVNIPSEGRITISGRRWLAPSQIILPGNALKELEYDDRLLLKRLTSRDGAGNVLLDYQYTRDDAGVILEIASEQGTYHYDYDDAYRLTSADHPVLGLESFSYDAAGNRFPADPILAAQWSYGDDNQLLTTDSDSYEYDAVGNLTRRVGASGDTRFTYDERNRLITVETGAGSLIAEYAYDPFGRRFWKDVGGNRTYFYYTPEGLAAEFDGSGNLIRSYGYEPGTSWTTAPLFMSANSNYAYYHNDQLGAPVKLTTRGGILVWFALYSSFGAAQLEVETFSNPLRRPGQYVDSETGLHQNMFRYYDSNLGRYIQEDPLLSLGLQENLYVYAGNNPINIVDPLGLQGQGTVTVNSEFTYTTQQSRIVSPTGGLPIGNNQRLFGPVVPRETAQNNDRLKPPVGLYNPKLPSIFGFVDNLREYNEPVTTTWRDRPLFILACATNPVTCDPLKVPERRFPPPPPPPPPPWSGLGMCTGDNPLGGPELKGPPAKPPEPPNLYDVIQSSGRFH